MYSDKLQEVLDLLRELRMLLARVDAAQTRKDLRVAYEVFSQHLAKVDNLMNQLSFDQLQDAEREELLTNLRELRLDPVSH